MIGTITIVAGFILDLIFGDPRGMIHPVQIIGWFINQFKKLIQKIIGKKQNPKAQLAGGFLLTIIIVVGTFFTVYGIMYGLYMIHPLLSYAAQTFCIYQILATKSLKKESMKVYSKLKAGDLEGARIEISYLVGRDTKNLNESEVAKAAVETIAENTSDGIIAPLFYIAIGGAPLGMAYKAINTLDSMVGYKNEEYLYLGRASAKLDDLVNFIPSRLAALLMIVSAYLLKFDGKSAAVIFKRDRFNHLSPNSAQTEAVAAGALHIQLGGTHDYFGKPVVKPTIGDNIRPIELMDIKKSNQLLYMSGILTLILMIACRTLVFCVF